MGWGGVGWGGYGAGVGLKRVRMRALQWGEFSIRFPHHLSSRASHPAPGNPAVQNLKQCGCALKKKKEKEKKPLREAQ